MWNAGLDETQARIKIPGINISNFRYADDAPLMAESEGELKSLLMKVKEERENPGLKLNIQKTKIMASSPITLWQIDGETMETVRGFIFEVPKSLQMVTAAMKFKRHLLLGRKVMTNLDSILKSRDLTLLTNVHLVKAMVFPAVMYGCECWIIKTAECWRTDAFELLYWRRLLRVPLDNKRIQPVHPERNKSWIYIGRTDAEAEAPILWPSEVKNWLFGKDLDAEKDWRQEEKETTENEMIWWHHRLNGHEFEQAPGVGDGQRSLVCCSPWGHRARDDRATQLNWLNSLKAFLEDN